MHNLNKAGNIVLLQRAQVYISLYGEAVCLTVVSKQGLGRTLRVWAGGLCASPAGETNATVSTAVALTSHSHVAPIYTPLQPQKHSNIEVQCITLLLAL